MKASEETMKRMQELTKLVRKNIEDYEKSDKKDYWRCPTSWMHEAAKYGAENIFLIGESYRSHAYDDYASFTYFNQATGKEFEGSWTTAGACPGYELHKCMSVIEAFRNCLLDEESYLSYMKKQMLEFVKKTDRFISLEVNDWIRYKLLIDVKGGRKWWNGRGYAVKAETKRWSYYASTCYISVYEPETNTIHEVDGKYCSIVDLDKMVEEYKQWAIGRIESFTTNDIKVRDEKMIVGEPTDYFTWMGQKAEQVVIDIENAHNPAQEERDRRKNEFKSRKMVELIEWVKNNTDKEGDSVQQLAEHIFQKRYA